MDDKRLKEIFGKLSAYETSQKGVEWQDVASLLPAFRAGGRVTGRTYLLIIIASLLLPFSEHEFVSDKTASSEKSQEANQIEKLPVNSAISHWQSHPIAADSQPMPLPVTGPDPVLSEGVSIMGQLSQDDQSFGDSARDEQAEGPKVLTEDSVQKDAHHTVVTEDAAAKEVPAIIPEKENLLKSLKYSIEVGYVFGIIEPVTSDNTIVRNFAFNPGFSIRGQVFFPINKRDKHWIYIVPSYAFVSKQFEMDAINQLPEYVKYERKVISSRNSFLGLGLALDIRSNWQLGISLQKSIGTPGSVIPDLMLSTDITRKITVSKKFFLTGSAGFSTPLSGQADYFAYTPVQLRIGLMKK